MSLRIVWLRLKKDKGALIGLFLVVLVLFMAIFASLISPYEPDEQNLIERRRPPSVQHWLGQDIYGRDMLTRIMYGARATILAGVLCVAMAGLVGSFLGLISGYFEGILGNTIMRFMDLMMSFPVFLLAILVVAVLGTGLINAVIAVAITTVPLYARVVRSSTLVVKHSLFVEASKALGGGDIWIILNHILPNTLSPIIVMSTVGVASAIIATAALGFIGLGAQPPMAEWGLMLNEGRSYITSAPHISLIPGVAIVLLVLGLNLLGDGLRDALDPRLK